MKLKMKWSFSDVFAYLITSTFLTFASVYTLGLLSYYLYRYQVKFFIEKSNLEDLGIDAKFEMSYGEFFSKVIIKMFIFGVILIMLTGFMFGSVMISSTNPYAAQTMLLPSFALWFLFMFGANTFITKIVTESIVNGISVDIKSQETNNEEII